MNDRQSATEQRFSSFSEFYPFYLEQHSNIVCRRLHVVGTSLSILTLIYLLVSQLWAFLPLALVVGYAFAWVGHFFFEHNRPATFTHPLYSLMGDFVMLRDVFLGRIKI
ncbi:DUF962 domain-containing protein [Salinispirillum sp. LH 10-3-1]|uniref:DUF962 domain-containing protein n=1 Tax=Salinispirillum sp. LH 10-3-1 TaxID=2952525 RepID=A0AB38YD22_9GAMM